MSSTYGFSQADWDMAKQEARNLLIARAKLRGMIPYSDLAKGITTVHWTRMTNVCFISLGKSRQRRMPVVEECSA